MYDTVGGLNCPKAESITYKSSPFPSTLGFKPLYVYFKCFTSRLAKISVIESLAEYLASSWPFPLATHPGSLFPLFNGMYI